MIRCIRSYGLYAASGKAVLKFYAYLVVHGFVLVNAVSAAFFSLDTFCARSIITDEAYVIFESGRLLDIRVFYFVEVTCLFFYYNILVLVGLISLVL